MQAQSEINNRNKPRSNWKLNYFQINQRKNIEFLKKNKKERIFWRKEENYFKDNSSFKSTESDKILHSILGKK